MANSSFELSQPSINQLNKSLDTLVTSMNKLESRLASLQKNSKSTFEKVFGSQKDFDAIIRSINKLSLTGTDGLKVLTSSIKSLAGVLGNLPSKAPTQFFGNLTSLIETVNKAKFKNNVDLTNFLKTISDAVKSLSSLGSLPGDAQQSIRLISTAIISAARLADDKNVMNVTGAKINQIKNIENLIAVYRKIVESLGGFDRLAPNAIVSLRNLGTFGKSVADLGRGFKLLTDNFEKVKLSSILKLGTIIAALSIQFRSIVALTQSTGSLKDVSVLGRVFDQVGTGLLAITRAVDQINLKQVAKIGLVVLAISGAFQGVAKLLASLPGFSALGDLSKILTSLGSSLAFFTKFADSLHLLKTIIVAQKLKIFFQALGGAFAAAANNVAKKHGLENIIQLAEVFSRLGPAITSILKISDKLPIFNPLKILKKFFEIRALVATVSQIANGLAKEANKLAGNKGLGNLDQLSVIFDRLGRGIRSLIGAMVVVDKAKIVNLNPVKELFKSLDPLFKQLRKFKNATLPDFGPIFDSLFKFANEIDNTKFDKQGLKDFGLFTKELAKGLNEFSKIRVDPAKLNAIAALLKSLKNSGGLSGLTSLGGASGIGVPLGQDLGDEVAEGFLKADLRKFLFTSLISIFKSLNPFSLARDFIAGFVNVFKSLVSVPDALIAKVRDVGNSLINLGGQLRSSGLNLINGLGLGGIANNSLFQAAVGFDDLSTQVENFGNLTKDQLKAAQEFSNEIGIKYPQSSNEALKATLNLLKAGLDLEDTFTALPAAADLSSISDTKDLDAASKAIILVTQSFKDFNEETVSGFENAGVAADIIARAANNSTASVESLTAGLANVASVANAAGLSLEETTAVLGLFSDAGITGAEGGTQLKSLLTNITRDTPAVRGELSKLGVSLKDEVGNIRPLNDILNDLSKALFETKTVTVAVNGVTADQEPRLAAAQKAYAAAARQVLLYNDGLTAGALDQEKASQKIGQFQAIQANAQAVIAEITGSQAETERITTEITRGQFDNFQSIQKLAGSFGQAGLNILLSQGQDALKSFIEEMGRLPTAAEQARLLLDNLKGDALQLQGSVESLGTRAFLPLINRVFRPLVKIGRLVVDFFSTLSDPILETIVNAGVLVSILATLVGGFLIIAGVVAQFGGTILVVVGTISSLALNLPLLVAGLTGFIAAFASLVVVATVVSATLLGISSVITTFFRTIEANVGGAGTALDAVKTTLSAIFTSIGEIFSAGGDIVSSIFGAGLNEQNVELGERLAIFFRSVNFELQVLKGRIQVIKAFFQGFQAFLSAGDEDQRRLDLIKQFTAEMPGAPQAIILDRVNQELSKTKTRLVELSTLLANSSFFEKIIGKDVTQLDVLLIFNDLKKHLLVAKDALFKSLAGGASLLLDFLGIKKLDGKQLEEVKKGLNDSLSIIGELVTKGLQKVTGLDLSEALLNFGGDGQGGGRDFKTGAQALITSLFTALKVAFFANQEGITNILSGIFDFLTPGKFLVPLLRFFGLNEVADNLKSIFDEISKLFRNSLGFIFDLLGGKSFDEALFGNFGTSAKPISRLIKAIGKALETLIGIFTDLFGVLFPGGVSGEGSFLESVIGGIASAFEFLTTTLLQPIRTILPNLINILGTLGETASVVLSGLFNILNKVVGPLTTLFSGLFSGDIDIGGFLSQLGPAILTTLQNLVQVLPGLLGTILSGIGTLIGSPLLTSIGTDLQNGDFAGALTTIATAVSSLIGGALAQVPTLITDLGTSLGAPLITKIGEALSTGDFGPVGDQIKISLTDAINSVPDKLKELGTTLGSPLLIKVAEAIASGDALSAITSISDSIAQTINTALGDVPSRLAELGATLNLSFLNDLGVTLEQSELFQKVLDGLSNLLALPFDTLSTIAATLSDFSDGIGKLFTEIGKANPIVVGALVLTLGALFALLVGPALLAGLGLLAAALTPVLLPILTVAAVLLVLKNGLQAVADVISGRKNVFEGISGFFTGLASDALGLLGIEITPEEIADRVTTFFTSVNGLVTLFINNALRQFENATSSVIDGLLGALDDARARVDQSAGFLSTGTGDVFFALEAAAKAGDFAAINEQLRIAAEKGLDFQPLNRLLRTNFEGVMTAFKAEIPNLASLSDVDFSNVVNTLVNANALDDAIAQLPADLIPGFYQRLFAVGASDLTALNLDSILPQLKAGLAADLFDLSSLEGFLLKLPQFAALTDDQKAVFLEELKAQLAPTVPVEVPLQITPTVLPPTEEDKTKVRTDIGLGLLLAGDAGAIPVTIPMTVIPEPVPATVEDVQKLADSTVLNPDGSTPTVALPVDVQAITDPATAALFADELQRVIDNSAVATTNLTLLQAQTILIAADLGTASAAVAQYALDVDTNTALAEFQWTEHSTLVQPLLQIIIDSLTSIKTKFIEIGTELETAKTTYPQKLVDLGTAFVAFVATAEPPLIRLIARLREVGMNLQQVLDKLAAVGAGGIAVDSNGNGVVPGGGREFGGSVFAGQLYEVGENNKSELLRIGGKTYLIPGGNGMVIPASPMSNVAPPTNLNNRTTSNNSSIIIQAPINVEVVAGVGANPQQIGQAVATQVRPLIEALPVNVNRTLKLAGVR